MKNNFFICVLCSFLSIGNAQNFTNQTVYNFAVGDTIVSYFYTMAQPNPPGSTFRAITGKTTSASQDTIFYTANDSYIDFVNPGSGYTTVCTYSTVNFIVTNLSSSLINFTLNNMSGCQLTKDTSFINSCGAWVHDKIAYSPTGCNSGPIIWYRFIEGVGSFYWEDFSVNGTLSGSRKWLSAYHKVNGAKCGNIGSIPNGLKENESRSNKISLYPNPSPGKVTITNNDKEEIVVKIYSFEGKLVYEKYVHDELFSPELQTTAGLYFITISDLNMKVLYTNKVIFY